MPKTAKVKSLDRCYFRISVHLSIIDVAFFFAHEYIGNILDGHCFYIRSNLMHRVI